MATTNSSSEGGGGVYVITGIQPDALDTANNSNDNNNKSAPLRVVPLRLELDEWFLSTDEEHVKQRALFFPAFKNFVERDPRDKLSYFQVAGIHGKPFVSWDEDWQGAEAGMTDNRGYCTHNSLLFATWHRPYLLLIEQIVYGLMLQEAKRFTGEEDEYVAAAKAWRLPYWDWALKKTPLSGGGERTYNIPVAFQLKKVPVRLPCGAGVDHEFENPIFQFTMPGDLTFGDKRLVSGDGDALKNLQVDATTEKDPQSGEEWLVPFDLCRATSRHPRGAVGSDDAGGPPTAQQWRDGQQNNDAVYKTLMSGDYVITTEGPDVTEPIAVGGKKAVESHGKTTESLRDTFYRIVLMENWEDFATKRALDGQADPITGEGLGNRAASIESTHDIIHLWMGGPAVKVEEDGKKMAYVGHMARVPYAAFDPIFWFHHANVDRQIAIWQTLNQDAEWFDPKRIKKDPRYKDVGNFFLKPEQLDTAETPLRPFHKSQPPANATKEELDASYFNSLDVKEVTELGYTYPVLEKWKYVDSQTGQYNRAAHLRALNEMLNHNYNAARSAGYKFDILNESSQGQKDGGVPAKPPSLPKLIAEGHQLKEVLELDDYAVTVTYEKFALGGYPFTINFFIGKVPDGGPPYSYAEANSSLVGEVYNFSSPSSGLGTDAKARCGNCKKQETASAMSTGRVVLTNALITRFKQQIVHNIDVEDGPPADGSEYVSVLEGIEPDKVVPFLKGNLHWRVTTATGQIIPLDKIPSLKVAFVAGKATHYADMGKASKFGEYKTIVGVTEGKAGGVSSADLRSAQE